MSRPLVLHLLPYDLARGAQVYARVLRDTLDGPDMAHRTAVLFEGEPGVLDPDFLLETPRWPFRRLGFAPRAARRLSELLATLAPDLIVTHGGEPLKYAGVVRGRTPLMHLRIGISAVQSGPRLSFAAALMRRADRVAGVSRECVDEAVELFGVDRDRTIVIPNGRDPEVYVPGPEPDVPNLIFVGHFAPTKRPAMVLDVVEALRARGYDFSCRMVGGGILLDDAFRTRAEGLDVDVLGRRTDVPDLLAGASMFVFTSVPEGEGMPGVFIEAGLAGLPTIATRVPGADTVIEEGTTGYIVDPDDFDGFVDRCARLLDDRDRRRRMGSAARERCGRTFTLEATFDLWRQEIDDLLGSARARRAS